MQSAWCASVKRGNPWPLQCLVHCTHIRICSRVSSHSSRFHCFNILQAFISGMYNTIKNAVGETASFTVSGVPCSTLAPPPPMMQECTVSCGGSAAVGSCVVPEELADHHPPHPLLTSVLHCCYPLSSLSHLQVTGSTCPSPPSSRVH